MKQTHRRWLQVLAAACAMAAIGQALAADRAAEEQAIRRADAQWSAATQSADLDAAMRIYAEDAVFLAPGQATIVGRQGIRDWFARQMATPGYSVTFAPDHIVVSASLDMAYETGRYRVLWTAPDGTAMAGAGKHLVAWGKRDGAWKVVAESISPDGPAEPASR